MGMALVLGGLHSRRRPNARANGPVGSRSHHALDPAPPSAAHASIDHTYNAADHSFHYDAAQTSNKSSMSALAAIIPVSQIMFGTDFPYCTSIEHVKGLRDAGVFTDAQLLDIERGNALKLLPRFAA